MKNYLLLSLILLAKCLLAQHFNQAVNLGNNKPFDLTNRANTVFDIAKKGTNLYIAGAFEDTFYVDDTSYVNQTEKQKIYLAKLTENGEKEWIRFIYADLKNSNSNYYYNQKLLRLRYHENNLYLAGNFEDTLRYKNKVFSDTGNTSIFKATFSESGQKQNIEKWGSSTYGFEAVFTDFNFDNKGNLIIGGIWDGHLNRDTGKFYFKGDSLSSAVTSSSFLAKLDTNEELQWLKRYNVSGPVTGTNKQIFQLNMMSIAIDDQNAIGIAGRFYGELETPNGTIQSRGINSQSNPRDMLVGKVSGNGKLLWAQSVGNKFRRSVRAYDVATAKNNTIIMVGDYGLYGYTPDGSLLFGIPTAGQAKFHEISTDPKGNFYAAGSFIEKLKVSTFQDTQSVSVGFARNYEGFLMKGDPLGEIEWLTHFGSAERDHIKKLITGKYTTYLSGVAYGDTLQLADQKTIKQTKGNDFILNIGNEDCDDLKLNPEFSLSPEVCQRDTVNLDGKSQSTKPLDYQWIIQDSVINGKNVIYTFPDTGKTLVKLVCKTRSGCREDTARSIQVNPAPISRFSFEKQGNGRVAFYPEDSSYAFYKWWFGDQNNTSQKVTPEHQYTQNGQFEVRLKTRIDSCSTLNKKSVNINNATRIDKPDLKNLDEVQVYPQPAQNDTRAIIHLRDRTYLRISLVTIQGKPIKILYRGFMPEGKNRLEIPDSKQIKSGLYFLQFKGKKSRQNKPVIYR